MLTDNFLVVISTIIIKRSIQLLHRRIEEKNYDSAIDIIKEIERTTHTIDNAHNNYLRHMLDRNPIGLTYVGVAHFSKKNIYKEE